MTTLEIKIRTEVTRLLVDRPKWKKDPLAEAVQSKKFDDRIDSLVAALLSRDSDSLYRWMMHQPENQWAVANLATTNMQYGVRYAAFYALSKAAWEGENILKVFTGLYERLVTDYGGALEYETREATYVAEMRSGLAANGFGVQENVGWLIRNLCIRGAEALNSAIRQNITRALEKGKCNKEFAVALVNACNEAHLPGAISSQTKTGDILIVAARNATTHDVVIEALANVLSSKYETITMHSADLLRLIAAAEQTDITIAIPELLRALQHENRAISKNAELALHSATIRAGEEVRNSVVHNIKELLESAEFMKGVNGNSPAYERTITIIAELMAKMELAYSELQGAAQ